MLRIANRRILSLSPLPTAREFLQGLCSNDTSKLPQYAAFLNVKGRVLFDAFMYPSDNSLLLDVPSTELHVVIRHLMKYRLRTKLDIEPWDGSVYYAKTGVMRDPRHPDLGWRGVQSGDQGEDDCSDHEGGRNLRYESLRLKCGIPEVPHDIVPGKSLPLESNLDLMGAIDFTKGCYVGQELTFRTAHRGVTRKRIVPFDCEDPLQIDSAPLEVWEEGVERPVGMVTSLHSRGTLGLALLRLRPIQEQKALFVRGQGGVRQGIHPAKPWWWGNLLQSSPMSFQ